MKDPKLIELLRQRLEVDPPEGLWKLTGDEMESLSEHMASFAFETYQRGFDDGFDSCMETFREGAETLFGVKV